MDDVNREFDELVAQLDVSGQLEEPSARPMTNGFGDVARSSEEQSILQEIISSDKPVQWISDKPFKVGEKTKRLRQMAFLKTFMECGTITKACRAIGISPKTELAWRTSDHWYIERFQEAIQTHRDAYQDFVRDWVFNGQDVPIVGKKHVRIGEDAKGNPIFGIEDAIIGYKKTRSELLTMFYGKRIDPAWKENYQPKSDEMMKDTASPLARIIIDIEERASRKVIEIRPEHRKSLPNAEKAPEEGQK